VRALLDHGADPNTYSVGTGTDKLPALYFACVSNNPGVVKLLLERGAKPNDGESVYHAAEMNHRACMLADDSAARAVIDKNPGIVASLTSEDQQMLHQAASSGRVEAVRMMAALGFNVAVTNNGATPLHEAAWRGRVDVVKLLLTLGAPLNVRDAQFGSSPIAWAAHGSRWCRSADEEYSTVIDALIEAGSQYAESINNSGEPPERLASPAVGAHLIARGFVPQKT
jgi:ankyrin repeat protein